MNISKYNGGLLEIMTMADSISGVMEEFNKIEQNVYTLKLTEKLYVIDINTFDVYELNDYFKAGNRLFKLIFTLVDDEDRKDMILGL